MQYGRYKRFEENKKTDFYYHNLCTNMCFQLTEHWISCILSSSIAGATALRRDILYMYPVGPETMQLHLFICSLLHSCQHTRNIQRLSTFYAIHPIHRNFWLCFSWQPPPIFRRGSVIFSYFKFPSARAGCNLSGLGC